MIQGRDIVCVSFVTWDDHWGTPQQLMSRLAARNRVLYVDQAISPLSLFTGIRSRAAVMRQFRRWRSGPREVAKNVYAAAPPPLLPWRSFKPINAFNALLLRRWLRRQVRTLGLRDVIYWNFQPLLPGLASATRPAKKVYHCVDEFSAVPYWFNSASSARAREAECCREADLIICTGRTLVEWRRAINPNTHFVGNAGNFPLFSRAALPETVVPDDIARLPGKVVGMLGVIDFRLDVDLIAYLAARRPDWSLALVGLVKGDAPLQRLRVLPNVHIMGFKPTDDLPGYLKGMDACLIPYALNEYTHHVFPLKLYDYMAAGKPIVSSDMAEIRPNAGHGFAIARSYDEFLSEIERAMAENSPQRVAERQELAGTHTWDHRVEEVSDLILSLRPQETPQQGGFAARQAESAGQSSMGGSHG
jgi:glycosyltransferase involved in cell wall biosynthesis